MECHSAFIPDSIKDSFSLSETVKLSNQHLPESPAAQVPGRNEALPRKWAGWKVRWKRSMGAGCWLLFTVGTIFTSQLPRRMALCSRSPENWHIVQMPTEGFFSAPRHSLGAQACKLNAEILGESPLQLSLHLPPSSHCTFPPTFQ